MLWIWCCYHYQPLCRAQTDEWQPATSDSNLSISRYHTRWSTSQPRIQCTIHLSLEISELYFSFSIWVQFSARPLLCSTICLRNYGDIDIWERLLCTEIWIGWWSRYDNSIRLMDCTCECINNRYNIARVCSNEPITFLCPHQYQIVQRPGGLVCQQSKAVQSTDLLVDWRTRSLVISMSEVLAEVLLHSNSEISDFCRS